MKNESKPEQAGSTEAAGSETPIHDQLVKELGNPARED